jgi:ClpX C4-type zinc finger
MPPASPAPEYLVDGGGVAHPTDMNLPSYLRSRDTIPHRPWRNRPFCGKKRQRVTAMVEAPDGPPAGKFARPADTPRICAHCLTHCDEILSEALGV